MIKKINKIINFGVFRDFKWDSTIPEFEKHNIFYGWNYSGKTTIARVFGCFENKSKHDDYPDAEFELIDDGEKKYSDNNLNQLPNIRVFNIDFVEKNLKRFQSSLEIEPIFILGQENIELQEKLRGLNEEVINLINENKGLENEKEENEKNLEKAYSVKAKCIKETLVIPDYEKRHLKPRVTNIKNDHKPLLSVNEYNEIFAVYQNKDQKESITLPNPFKLKFSDLLNITKSLVEKKITAQKIIIELKDNPRLSAWVREGKTLHEQKTFCRFCGNKLPIDLVDKLDQHFSDEYSKLEADIENLVSDIKSHKREISDYLFPDKARFYGEFSEQYENAKQELLKEMNVYLVILDGLINGLESKKLRPFENQNFIDPPNPTKEIADSFSVLIDIVELHNAKTVNFVKEKNGAKEKLLDHFAAGFIDEQKLLEFEGKQETLGKKIYGNKQLLDGKESEIKKMETELSDLIKGAEKVNEYIQQFFRHDGIKLKVNQSEKFILVRDDVPAKNLSEGEKTAISLAYFIARLEDKGTKLEDTIVFIDDPVSSLDSNHLFNMYAFIKSKLEDCLQLFISTHNMDFFNLMKDFLGEIGYKNKPKLPCYLVRREWNMNTNRSVIEDLPHVLKHYHSEYVYLFGMLKEFDEHDDATLDHHKTLYLIPNIARRFLEGYLGLRYPDGKSWESKLDRLIRDETKRNQIRKLVHEYSHNRSAIRSLKFPEPVECKEVIGDILSCLQSVDKEHYDALCSGM
jgi:wobble nucleotide-excising tRNase